MEDNELIVYKCIKIFNQSNQKLSQKQEIPIVILFKMFRITYHQGYATISNCFTLLRHFRKNKSIWLVCLSVKSPYQLVQRSIRLSYSENNLPKIKTFN